MVMSCTINNLETGKGDSTTTIIHGSVLDVIPKTGGAHLFFADPPYNLGIDYGKGKNADQLADIEYEDFCSRWLSLASSQMRNGGAAFVLSTERYADQIGHMMKTHIGPRANRIIWREGFAQYTPHRFTNEHRHLFYHVKGLDIRGRTWNTDDIRVKSVRQKMGDKRAKGLRVPGDVWEVSRLQGTSKERVDWHPAQIRQSALRRIVQCSTNPGDTVVEFFAGSGSMALVCMDLERHYVGIDDNADYVAKMIERCKAHDPKKGGGDARGQ